MGLWTTRFFVSSINLVICVQCLPAVDPQAKMWGLCLQINHSDISIWIFLGFKRESVRGTKNGLSVPRVPVQLPPGELLTLGLGAERRRYSLLVLIPGCPEPGPEQEIEN